MASMAVEAADFYANLGRLLSELTALRECDLRPLRLDLDHYFILEAVASGRARSEAEMVRRLGRNASFCSRAVGRMVERGWLKKQPKPQRDIKFQVKLTRKGRGIYQELQAGFAERVRQKLAAAPLSSRKLPTVLKQVVIFSQLLFGATIRDDTIKQAENEMLQQPLPGLAIGGAEVSKRKQRPARSRRPTVESL